MFFTQKPQEEIARKRFFFRQKAKELKVASHLIRYVYGQAAQTGLPVFSSYGNRQQGESFAARLANEAEKVYAQGYEQLLIIGNDCPAITTEALLQAARSCEAGNLVLGPAEDGGVYLIALPKSGFDKARFLQLPWESDQLFEAFCQWQVPQEILPPLIDIDSPRELVRAFQFLPDRHPLVGWFRHLLTIRVPVRFWVFLDRPGRFILRFISLRAPPMPTRHI